MTILTVRTVGDPVLRTVCDEVTTFDNNLKKLIADMLETMYEVNGVGLAGPQVGVAKRIFTYGNIDHREGYIINPVIEVGFEDQDGGEGCLSVPGLASDTPRKMWAKVTGVDADNRAITLEGEGLFARMLQHETDHLVGKMFIDRLVGENKKRVMRELRKTDFERVSATTRAERASAVGSAFGLSGVGRRVGEHDA